MLSPATEFSLLRLAFYRTSSIGDVVLSTTCLNLLQKLGIPHEAYWIGRGASLSLISAAYPQLQTIDLAKTATLSDIEAAIARLGNIHFLIDLQTNLRSHYFRRRLAAKLNVPVYAISKSQFARSKMVLMSRWRGRRVPLPESLQEAEHHQFEMANEVLLQALRTHLPAEQQNRLTEMQGVPYLPLAVTLAATQAHAVYQELRNGVWLAVAPGAAHPTKKAPVGLLRDTLVGLQHRLHAAQPNVQVGLVLFGDENDRTAATELLDLTSWQGPVLNLAGRLSLWESAQALSLCRVLLSNDSSLLHIAEAVEVPVGAMFGPTVEAFGFAPRKKESRAFSVNLGCRPCSKHGKVDCRYGDQLCFGMLKAEVITDFLYARLGF